MTGQEGEYRSVRRAKEVMRFANLLLATEYPSAIQIQQLFEQRSPFLLLNPCLARLVNTNQACLFPAMLPNLD